MLLADKRALETSLKVNLLSIREKELNFYTNNCLTIGTISALLAGFAYAALQKSVEKKFFYVHLMYLIFSVASLGFQLLAVVSTTLLAMLGPGLALRGPDGSMHRAVDSMVGEYRKAFFAFLKGLLALHGAAMTYSILMLQVRQAQPIAQASRACSNETPNSCCGIPLLARRIASVSDMCIW